MRFKTIKLSDCRQHGASTGAELFVVEGDSAAYSVQNIRDMQMQAVLPMQGKPMNTLRVSQDKLMQNPLFAAFIEALGAGVGESFDSNKRRYEKVLLLMDPDADGIHCGVLMLLFFYRWMRLLLEQGKVYMVRAPMGEVLDTDSGEIEYTFIETQFLQLCEQAQKQTPPHFRALRYRGLASLDPSKLAQFCVIPETRNAIPMSIKDAEMAMQVFGNAS